MVIGTYNGIDDIYWGDEVGTPEFYMVERTLMAYLGDNYKVYNHDTNATFIVETTTTKDVIIHMILLNLYSPFMTMLIHGAVKRIYLL